MHGYDIFVSDTLINENAQEYLVCDAQEREISIEEKNKSKMLEAAVDAELNEISYSSDENTLNDTENNEEASTSVKNSIPHANMNVDFPVSQAQMIIPHRADIATSKNSDSISAVSMTVHSSFKRKKSKIEIGWGEVPGIEIPIQIINKKKKNKSNIRNEKMIPEDTSSSMSKTKTIILSILNSITADNVHTAASMLLKLGRRVIFQEIFSYLEKLTVVELSKYDLNSILNLPQTVIDKIQLFVLLCVSIVTGGGRGRSSDYLRKEILCFMKERTLRYVRLHSGDPGLLENLVGGRICGLLGSQVSSSAGKAPNSDVSDQVGNSNERASGEEDIDDGHMSAGSVSDNHSDSDSSSGSDGGSESDGDGIGEDNTGLEPTVEKVELSVDENATGEGTIEEKKDTSSGSKALPHTLPNNISPPPLSAKISEPIIPSTTYNRSTTLLFGLDDIDDLENEDVDEDESHSVQPVVADGILESIDTELRSVSPLDSRKEHVLTGSDMILFHYFFRHIKSIATLTFFFISLSTSLVSELNKKD